MIGNRKYNDWMGFFAPRFLILSVLTGFVVRIILLCSPLTEIDFSFAEWMRIFGLGAVNDIAFAAIGIVPAFLYYCTLAPGKYDRPTGYIIEGILAALAVYVICFNDITDEYAGVVPGIANVLVALMLAVFSLKLFIPAFRRFWRKWSMLALILIYVCFLMLFSIIGEPVFWDEFGVRYNFIAVDYLVYTNEVIGNIVESYPMGLISSAVAAAAVLITWLFTRKCDIKDASIGSPARFVLTLMIVAACAFGGAKWLHWSYRNLVSPNVYVTELQDNGFWNFLEAYSSNELNYKQFYEMMDESEAVAVKNSLCGHDADGVARIRTGREPEKKNIVLITIESLSADFLAAYGNTKGITPNLDSLIGRSLVFDNMFATGNRTVRGLEALTLCIPPSSGESLVKRPFKNEFFSTGHVLREHGYTTRFIYGGLSYFDNMGPFFAANGYEILDKQSYDKSAIIFDNIWGTCDEDSYREALSALDRDYAEGRPFFTHLMTISNHRPYTYPEGRIQYDGDPMSRKAAVKYTDYAIGDFLKKAATRPWFNETVFVIVADHCASSAGKTNLPLDCYHIPAIVYSPSFIKPQRVSKICSQIDLMPTLFNILGISYDSPFYGRDVLDDGFRERAFMATYQDLGYYADSILTVLSPVKRVRQFDVTTSGGWDFEETERSSIDVKTALEAKASYQVANLSFAF